MRTLYLQCNMGAAGDMLTGALLELLEDPSEFLESFRAAGLPGVEMRAQKITSCGILGTKITVTVNGQTEEQAQQPPKEDRDGGHHRHHHATPGDVESIVSRLAVPSSVKADILAVYEIIARAESQVHGIPVREVHFHEVGMMDAIADITAVCLLVHRLAPDEIAVSPVHVGRGQVRCAHGILPVPAPATAVILENVPIYGETEGELCTPTGAALLKYFASRFGNMPPMTVEKIGYGMGTRQFSAANCVRAFLGQSEEQAESPSEPLSELSCNVDDMTAEEIGFATEILRENGALDVYTTSVGMKKSRPAVQISVLCTPQDRDRMIRLLFRHTATLGVRECPMRRYILDRSSRVMQTPYGAVTVKSSCGYGVRREKPEYEDLAKMARERGISLREAQTEVLRGKEPDSENKS